MSKISKLTDEECLEKFFKLLDRVEITTLFINEPDTENLTHQVLRVSCGELVAYSQPEELATVLRPSTGAELGATVN